MLACVPNASWCRCQAEPLPSLFGAKYGVELVLASDVVYHEEVVTVLMETVQKLFDASAPQRAGCGGSGGGSGRGSCSGRGGEGVGRSDQEAAAGDHSSSANAAATTADSSDAGPAATVGSGGIAAFICFELRHAEVTEMFLTSAYMQFDCVFIPPEHQVGNHIQQ